MDPKSPISELPIDTSLTHYMEERALQVALSKATDDGQRAKVQELMALRAELMIRRQAYLRFATTKRHARGEVYSDAMVKRINSMGPSRASLEANAQALYQNKTDAISVLKEHALVHFGQELAMQRHQLNYITPDVLAEAKYMLMLDEVFAAQWVSAIGQGVFTQQIKKRRVEAAKMLRTGKTGMQFVCTPEYPQQDAIDATVLGQAWNKLDEIAQLIGVKPLSDFIGMDGQTAQESTPATQILPSVDALLVALQDSTHKIPAKKATQTALKELQSALTWLAEHNGTAYFEVDL